MQVPSIHITLDGKPMDAHFEVVSADVYTEVNRVPWAEICLIDGDAANGKWPLVEGGTLDIGTKITVAMRYVDDKGNPTPVFHGLITRLGIEVDGRGQLLRIECRHAAFAMTRVRKSATFPNENDHGAISKVLATYQPMPIKWKDIPQGGKSKDLELVQYQATDWDFMLSRCAANGWLIVPDGPGLSILKGPKLSVSVPMDHRIDFMANEIYSMELALDGGDQYEGVSAQAWSFQDQAVTPATHSTTEVKAGTKVHPSALKNVSTGITEQLFTGTGMKATELKNWADGVLTRSRLTYVRGRIEFAGNAKLKAGDTCRIQGFSPRFDGAVFATAVRQRLSVHGWITDVQVGLPQAALATLGRSMGDLPASGLLPAVNGLQIGVVQAFKADPLGEYRVQVALPALQNEDGGKVVWARWACASAGKGAAASRGLLAWPEPGDEVVVGFLNDDPRAAIALGSLFNAKNAPLYPADADNNFSGWTTKSGSKISFDDKRKEIVIATHEMLQLKFSETDKAITLEDLKGKAMFKLSDQGILLSFKDNRLEINAKGVFIEGASHKVQLDKAGVNVDGGGDKVKIKGGSVELM